MKISSKVMKEAHKLTKEIKAAYPEVDYKTQLGICIKYLLSEKEENMKIFLTSLEERGKMAEVLSTEKVNTSKGTFELPTLVEAEGIKVDLDYNVWEKYGKIRIYFGRNMNGYIEILADGSAKAIEGGMALHKSIERGIAYLINGKFAA